eukprot:gnl/TRDRNA2_/TRDRNA2_37994_c0_seq1.p2 gnl/TRDRNA2_/TRDRNA2_37994_c0~~gnl/TRDRNA2_/TRDRNA2_37994_c0_seq1.p2  ORF type:complete len:187 (+),score=37.44 gnl/TRDRNA2_/TRDRNA2_37994_c0_seq1:60-620(+)
MLLPMPAMPQPVGPLSEYAISRRPMVLGVLILQSVLCLCRMFMFLDIMGGFIMALVVALGWYAWKEDMHITFICYWGLMCVVQGLFAAVLFLDTAVHGHITFKGAAAVGAVVQIGIPVAYALGAVLSWNLYQDATESQDALPFSAGYSSGERSPLARSFGGGSTGGGNKPSFQVFSGGGHKLGSSS